MTTNLPDVATVLPETEGLNQSSDADVPITLIEARSSWQALNLNEIWRYRELLFFFAWRDVKIKYKQTVLGVAWTVLQPLTTMIVMTVLFGRLVGLEGQTGGIPYPVFVFAGLLPWNLFAECLGGASNSVVNSGHIITKIYFPRLLVPIAAVGANLVNFAISLTVLLGLMLYYQVVPGPELLLLPILLGLLVMASLSVGILLSALNVAYRDVRHMVPFIVQMGMFLTPVIYPVSIIPESYRWLLALNPMAGIVSGFRYCLLGQPVEWGIVLISALTIMAAFMVSIFVFRRIESRFADII